MKDSLFNKYSKKEEPLLKERNAKESLINQIVECTYPKKKTDTEKYRKNLAKRIGIYANKYKWTTTDLHYLLQKRNDPSIRNFSSFVEWSLKDKNT